METKASLFEEDKVNKKVKNFLVYIKVPCCKQLIIILFVQITNQKSLTVLKSKNSATFKICIYLRNLRDR